jgi:hypothetical protein
VAPGDQPNFVNAWSWKEKLQMTTTIRKLQLKGCKGFLGDNWELMLIDIWNLSQS